MATISKSQAEKLRAMYRVSKIFSRVSELMKSELDNKVQEYLNGDTELVTATGEILVNVNVVKAHVREIREHTRTTWPGMNTREEADARDTKVRLIKSRYWKI